MGKGCQESLAHSGATTDKLASLVDHGGELTGNAKCLLALTTEHITAAKEKTAPRAHKEKPLPPARLSRTLH